LSLKDEDELPAAYRLGKARADDQEDAESDRLLYVAATRAREKLILSGCISLKQDGTPGKLGGWLGEVAQSLRLGERSIPYDEQGMNAIHLDLQVDQTPTSCTIYEPEIIWDRRTRERGAELEALTLPPPLLGSIAAEIERVDPRVEEQDRIPPQRVWRVVPAVKSPRAPAWVVGSLAHEALAVWRFPAGAASTSDGVSAPAHSFEHWAEARARGYGIADARQLADAIRQSRRLLLRFQAHPLYREMDQADRRLHEIPYSLEVDGRVESGIVDALYLREGTWTIVEFKTDRVKDEADFERLLKEKDYVNQARRYIAAMKQLTGQRPRCILCMLNWDKAVRLYTDDNFE
jgi:ATP-dependent exoDNAse (exonuclease V) beta subunit